MGFVIYGSIYLCFISLFLTKNAFFNGLMCFFSIFVVFLCVLASYPFESGLGYLFFMILFCSVVCFCFVFIIFQWFLFDRRRQPFEISKHSLNIVSFWGGLVISFSSLLIIRHFIERIGTSGFFVFGVLLISNIAYLYCNHRLIGIISWKTLFRRIIQYQSIICVAVICLNFLTPLYVMKKASDASGGKPYCIIVYSAPEMVARWIDLNFLTMTQHTFSDMADDPHATVSYRGDDGKLQTDIWSYNYLGFSGSTRTGIRECDPDTGGIRRRF